MKTAITSENEHADGQMTTNPADNQLVTIVLLVLATVIAVPILFMSFGMLGSGPMMGGMWGSQAWGGGTAPWWMLAAGLAVQLLFLVAAVAAVYLLYRAITGTGDADRALEELRLAYARGDITDEEYEQRKDASNEIPDCCLSPRRSSPIPAMKPRGASVVSDDHDFDPVHAVEVTESVR